MIKKLLICVISLALLNGVIWYNIISFPNKELKVAFLDVGQGDAIFIEVPNGTQVLIDGGPDTTILRELGSIMGFLDRTIDIVLLSHGDNDHVGGLPKVLERYEVGTIVTTAFDGPSHTFNAFKELSSKEGAYLIEAKRGQVIDLGDGAYLTLLYPDQSAHSRSLNNTSIVARLDYGETSFLFTGDIEEEVEERLVSLDTDTSLLDTDVLKVAHHGSKTSSSESFLEFVTPTYAVIQVGKENRYGHPHGNVIDSLKKFAKHIYLSYQKGTFVVLSNGTDLWTN